MLVILSKDVSPTRLMIAVTLTQVFCLHITKCCCCSTETMLLMLYHMHIPQPIHACCRAPASWSRQQQDMFALLCQPAVDEAAGVGMKGTRARISMLLPGVPDSAAIGAYDW